MPESPNQPSEALAYLFRKLDRTYDLLSAADAVNVDDLSDEQVKTNMAGHAQWDDPPDGWGERELLIWSRGYLHGRAIQGISDAETVYSLKIVLRQVLEHQAPALNDRELLLIAYLLQQGAEAIGSRICQDAHPDAEGLLTQPELHDLGVSFERYNSGGAYDPSMRHDGMVLGHAMAHRLRLLLAHRAGLSVPAGRYDADSLMRTIGQQLRPATNGAQD